MKVSFLLSVALGIAMVVMVFVLWTILAGMGVFDQRVMVLRKLSPLSACPPISRPPSSLKKRHARLRHGQQLVEPFRRRVGHNRNGVQWVPRLALDGCNRIA